jgi:hypothetical protein
VLEELDDDELAFAPSDDDDVELLESDEESDDEESDDELELEAFSRLRFFVP